MGQHRRMEPQGILFVCTGNICRSPTAEGVFRHMAAAFQAPLHIDSAGIEGYHEGQPPDPRAVKAAQNRGIDIAGLRARRVRKADFSDFGLILAMDRTHLNALKSLAPRNSAASVALFMDFAPASPPGRDVPDPYYGTAADFEHVLTMIEDGASGLLHHLRNHAA